MSKPDSDSKRLRTENKAVLKELESERLKKAIANSPVTVYGLDCNLRYKWVVNPKVTGSEKEMIGQKVGSAGHVIDVKRLVAFYTEVLKSGKSERRELRLDYGNQFSIFDIFANVEKNEKGEVTGLTATSTDITERKKAEEALKQIEEKYHQLFNSMTEMFQVIELVYNKQGKAIDYYYRDVNPAFEKLAGKTREQLVDKRVKDIFGVVEDYWLEAYEKVAKSGNPVHFENYGAELDKWYEIYAWKANDQVAIVFTEITKRKKTEEALRNAMQQTDFARKRLETILETSPSAVVIIEAPDGRFSLVNKRAQALYGIDFRGVDLATNVAKVKASRPDGTAYPVDDVPASRALRLGEEVRNEEMIIYRADGAAIPVFVSAGPIRDAQGNIAAAIVIFEDITERKKIEESLRKSEKEYSSLFANMMDGFVYCQMIFNEAGKPIDYVYLQVNDAFEKITGLKRELIVGKKVSEVVPGINEDNPELFEIYGRVALTGQKAKDEHFQKYLNVWLNVSVYCPAKGYFAAILEDITERKKAEEALRESESMLQNIIDGSPSFIFLKDKDGRFITINKWLEKSLGMKREELRGKTDYDIFSKEVADNYRKNDLQVLETKQAIQSEEIFDSPDGKKYTLLANKFPLFNSSGEIIATCSISTDITQRKKAEEALQESEQRWATTLASIGDAVIATDTSGKIMFLNGEAEELTGWKLSEASQKPVKEVFNIVNEQTRLEVENPIDRVLREGMVVGLANHTVLIQKNGSEVPIDDSGAPIKDKDGKTTGVVLIFSDITERKKAEEKLDAYSKNLEKLVEERTRKLALSSLYARTLIEASLDPLVTISAEGKITDVNKATENATGRSRDELIGSDFSSYFVEPEKAKIGYRRVFSEGIVKDYPLAIKHRNGRILDVLYNATVYTNEAGEIQGVFAAARDISELRKAEAEAKESDKKLKDSERLAAIGATAGMVGHDIRNPLQAITSDVYLAKTEIASTPDSEEKKNAMESLTGIEKNIDYINKIVQDLQDYARPLNPKVEESDLRQIVESFFVKNGFPENVEVNVEVAEGTRKIRVDPYYLNRILYNLVTNAVQAMPQGGKLTVRSRKEENDTVITVSDTGVGIPKAVQEKMFTLMFTTKSKGQGFGLPVVRRMTESLGGSVTFETQEGKGTTFIVRLPPSKS